MSFLLTFTLTTVVVPLNGTTTEPDTDLLLKTHNSGPMKITGNGQQSLTREKASFLKENILPMQESGQLSFYRCQQQEITDLPLILRWMLFS